MAARTRLPRVLLMTSGPLDGRGGSDIRLASAVAQALPAVDFFWFARWPTPAAERTLPGRGLWLVSLDGIPHRQQRLQAAVLGAAAARRVDFVHAVMSIGKGFPLFSRTWTPLLGGRPVLHTVPGILSRDLPARSRPLGRTVAQSATTAGALEVAGFGQVMVIPPTIALEEWPMVPRLSDGTPVVLFTGYHDADGGARDAVLAASVAVRAGARFRLILAVRARPGQNGRALDAELLAFAERQGLSKVAVPGHVADMRTLMASADVLLYVPRVCHSGADVPMTVLEALSTGRPVIVSDHPQFAPLGDTVLRAPPGDPHRTGHLLRQLLERPHWWQVLAERSRATVEERYSVERFRAQYMRVYEELLQ